MIWSRPTIHVVTEFKRDSNIESYWYECFHDEDFYDYDVNIIDGTFTSHESYLWSDAFFKSVQLRFILDAMARHKIRDGDIVVFANAWNYAVIPLSYFRDEFRMDISIIGFWGDSLFNQDSPTWQRFKRVRKDWGRQLELSLFNSYDMNCFWCERHWQLFKSKFANLKGSRINRWNGQVISSYAITGHPFGFLAKEAKVSSKKEDVIIYPYNLRNDVGKHIVRGLSTDLPQYKFVFAQDEANNRVFYDGLLQDAKMMICANSQETDPVLLYEGMVNGVIPLVPERLAFPEIFPERYLYPSGLTIPKSDNMVNVHRLRKQFEDIVSDTMNRYDELKDQLSIDAKKIGNKYYSNKPFMKVLKQVAGIPKHNLPPKVKKKYIKKNAQY